MSSASSGHTSLLTAYEHLVAQRGLTDDPLQRAVIPRLDKLASELLAVGKPRPLRRWLRLPPVTARGIYLWGHVGRGKTLLMDLLQSALPQGCSRRLHFHVLMREVHDLLAAMPQQQSPLQEVARQLSGDLRLLCLDELLVTDIGDAMILHGLLAALQQHGVSLMITSNQPPTGLYRNGLQRERFLPAIDLLSTTLDVIELSGPVDYRLRQLQQAGTYVLLHSPQDEQALNDLFTQLAGEARAQTDTSLTLEGRSVACKRLADGIAWFEFAALCEGTRSTSDYLALASQMHTLFVSGVPQMDALQDDAARRFVSLVDVLYDQGITLVLGAAVAPTALYQGSRLSGEFARTVSRLIEMGSADYLGRARRGGNPRDDQLAGLT